LSLSKRESVLGDCRFVQERILASRHYVLSEIKIVSIAATALDITSTYSRKLLDSMTH
jgi:hypothetical protein